MLNALHLEKPILVGHSVAGQEMSSIAARYRYRIGALIYLDAAWDDTYVAPKDKQSSADFDTVGIPSEPEPDSTTFDPQRALNAGVEKPDYAHIRIPALGTSSTGLLRSHRRRLLRSVRGRTLDPPDSGDCGLPVRKLLDVGASCGASVRRDVVI